MVYVRNTVKFCHYEWTGLEDDYEEEFRSERVWHSFKEDGRTTSICGFYLRIEGERYREKNERLCV